MYKTQGKQKMAHAKKVAKKEVAPDYNNNPKKKDKISSPGKKKPAKAKKSYAIHVKANY